MLIATSLVVGVAPVHATLSVYESGKWGELRFGVTNRDGVEVTPEELARFFEVVLPHINELQRRVVAGAAAEMLGRGGKTLVATASGDEPQPTVIKAVAEVAEGVVPSDRLRALGGGDRPLTDKQPGLLKALDDLVHPEIRGTPMSSSVGL